MTEFKSEALAGYEAEERKKAEKRAWQSKLEAAQARAATMTGSMMFEQPAVAFEYGELRSRAWQAPFTNGLTDAWRQRCNEYWKRIEQRFGVIMSEPRNAWAMDDIYGPVVGTYAVTLIVLPGKRLLVPQGERITH